MSDEQQTTENVDQTLGVSNPGFLITGTDDPTTSSDPIVASAPDGSVFIDSSSLAEAFGGSGGSFWQVNVSQGNIYAPDDTSDYQSMLAVSSGGYTGKSEIIGIPAEEGDLFFSNDGGKTWTKTTNLNSTGGFLLGVGDSDPTTNPDGTQLEKGTRLLRLKAPGNADKNGDTWGTFAVFDGTKWNTVGRSGSFVPELIADSQNVFPTTRSDGSALQVGDQYFSLNQYTS